MAREVRPALGRPLLLQLPLLLWITVLDIFHAPCAVAEEQDAADGDSEGEPTDDFDAASGGGEDDGSGGGGGLGGLSEQAQAKLAQFEADGQARRAQSSHAVMQQFLHNFARNMKYSVLADSRGDIPEAKRQMMMRQLRPGDDAGGLTDAPSDDEINRQFPGRDARLQQASRHPRRKPHRRLRMLNGPVHVSAAAAEGNGGEDAVLAAASRGAGAPESEGVVLHAIGSHAAHEERQAMGMFEAGEAALHRGSHADSMRQIRECADEDCVRAILSQGKGLGARAAGGGGDDGGDDAVLAAASRGGGAAADDDDSEGGDAAPVAAAPPPKKRTALHQRKHRGPDIVQDAMGRKMPVLFSAQPQPVPEDSASSRSAPLELLLVLAAATLALMAHS